MINELTMTTRSSRSSESRFSTVKTSRTGSTVSLTRYSGHSGESTNRTQLWFSWALNCRRNLDQWFIHPILHVFHMPILGLGVRKDRRWSQDASEEKCRDIPHGSRQINVRLLIIRLLRGKHGYFGVSSQTVSQLKLLKNILTFWHPCVLNWHTAKSSTVAENNLLCSLNIKM